MLVSHMRGTAFTADCMMLTNGKVSVTQLLIGDLVEEVRKRMHR